MQRLLYTDGHGVASILGDFDCRWLWLKCQVDRPSGAEAITDLPISGGPPRKRRENGVEVPTDGEQSSQANLPGIFQWYPPPKVYPPPNFVRLIELEVYYPLCGKDSLSPMLLCCPLPTSNT
eukprot:scaffold5048_cov82-Cyclotella_meneghiniana.AAC.6